MITSIQIKTKTLKRQCAVATMLSNFFNRTATTTTLDNADICGVVKLILQKTIFTHSVLEKIEDFKCLMVEDSQEVFNHGPLFRVIRGVFCPNLCVCVCVRVCVCLSAFFFEKIN